MWCVIVGWLLFFWVILVYTVFLGFGFLSFFVCFYASCFVVVVDLFCFDVCLCFVIS